MNNNGKRIVVLCILLVLGGGWAGLASRYAGQGERAQSRQPESAASTNSEQDGVHSTPYVTDPQSDATTGISSAAPLPIGLDKGGFFFRMMLSVGLVTGLGAAAWYLSKKVLPRVTNAAGREIRVIETTGLGPRKALHLVEVGDQRLLIASTNDNVIMLTHVGEGIPGAIEGVGDPDPWLDASKQERAEAVRT